MRLLFAPLLLCCAAGALAQSFPRAPRADDVPPVQAAPRPDDAPPTRAMPSVPSAPSQAGAPVAATPATNAMGAGREPNPLAVDPRGGSWGNPMAPQVGVGFEDVLNSGTPRLRGQAPRKVCPPGLVNRDGNCVAPAGAILGR